MATASTREFTDRVIPLLREYTGKFEQLKERARTVRNELAQANDANPNSIQHLKSDFNETYQAFHSQYSPARRLVGQVSQMIEHGGLDDLDRLELGLRLAEFESTLNSARIVLSSRLK